MREKQTNIQTDSKIEIVKEEQNEKGRKRERKIGDRE